MNNHTTRTLPFTAISTSYDPPDIRSTADPCSRTFGGPATSVPGLESVGQILRKFRALNGRLRHQRFLDAMEASSLAKHDHRTLERRLGWGDPDGI